MVIKMEGTQMKRLITNTLEKIKQFNIYLNQFDYGMILNGITYTNNPNFDNYITISPQNFEKYKCGVCWDFTTYEYNYFKTHFPFVEIKCYYIQLNTLDNIEPTHTWLSFKYNNYIYSFESSWLDLQGIRKFTSEKDMLDFYLAKHIKASKSKCTGLIITEYIPPIIFGQTPEEFMAHCLNGKKIRQVNFVKKQFFNVS